MTDNNDILTNPNVITWENYKEEQIVVFLDLLGFSNATKKKENIEVAIGKVQDYNEMLKQAIDDCKQFPVEKYEGTLKTLAERSYVTSFENFIVGSDSIIITSSKCNINIFVHQLCHFLYSSYSYYASNFEYAENIDDVTIGHIIGISPTGQPVKYTYKHSPCLFRGGCVIGKAIATTQTRIVDNKDCNDSRNIIGEAVTRAVKMEEWLTGPRILCDKKFYELCDDDIKKHYFRQISDNELKSDKCQERNKMYGSDTMYELLWMAPMFVNDNVNGIPQANASTIIDVKKALTGAYNLFSSKSNEKAKSQYLAFLNLIRDTSLSYWNNNKIISEGIEEWIKDKKILILRNNRIEERCDF